MTDMQRAVSQRGIALAMADVAKRAAGNEPAGRAAYLSMCDAISAPGSGKRVFVDGAKSQPVVDAARGRRDGAYAEYKRSLADGWKGAA